MDSNGRSCSGMLLLMSMDTSFFETAEEHRQMFVFFCHIRLRSQPHVNLKVRFPMKLYTGVELTDSY